MGFRDDGDGTVTDDSTGLMWERKTQPPNQYVDDVHNVNYAYSWSASGQTGAEQSGTAFTLFLRILNESRFAGHSDWRLPTVQELLSIVDASRPYPVARINEIFGPTNVGRRPPTCYYWTSETRTDLGPENLANAWSVNFGFVDSQTGYPEVQSGNKAGEPSVRAVRNA